MTRQAPGTLSVNVTQVLLLGCLLMITASAPADTAQCKGTDKLQINDKTVTVEVARDERSRRYGLMFRRHMGENCGMLFVFQNVENRTFTMQNTLIPLDIAFIAENGTIAEIFTMQPGVARYPSTVQSRYALEVNAGWFDKNNSGIGSEIKLEAEGKLLPLISLLK